MKELVEWALNVGRSGGLIGMLFGLLILAVSYWEFAKFGVSLPVLVAFGIVLVVIGALILIFGSSTANSARKNRIGHHVTVEELERELRKHAYPYTLCLLNRRVVSGGIYGSGSALDRSQTDDICDECKPGLDHIEISNDEDLKLALASLER